MKGSSLERVGTASGPLGVLDLLVCNIRMTSVVVRQSEGQATADYDTSAYNYDRTHHS